MTRRKYKSFKQIEDEWKVKHPTKEVSPEGTGKKIMDVLVFIGWCITFMGLLGLFLLYAC